MEQWEIDLRNKLNKELEDGIYQIDNLTTGKQGYIDFEVAMYKEVNDKGLGVKQLIQRFDNPTYGTLTIEKLNKIAYELFNNKNMDKIKVKIVNKSTNENPKYATIGSAGMDVKAYIDDDTFGAVPDYNMHYSITLKPGERAMIPTGIYMELPIGYQVEVRPRSGLAAKNGIMVTNSPGTIDSDYRGECNVLLINNGSEDFTIYDGDRIAQFVLQPAPQIEWIDCETLDNTDRGSGGFGSTGV